MRGTATGGSALVTEPIARHGQGTQAPCAFRTRHPAPRSTCLPITTTRERANQLSVWADRRTIICASKKHATAKSPCHFGPRSCHYAPLRLASARSFLYIAARQRVGRPRFRKRRRGKSGSMEPRCRVTPGGPPLALAKGDQGKCHRKDTARLRTGKVERVRQERTAGLATGPAR